MHEIARRARDGEGTITQLVEAFYGPAGPLAERGWEVRPQQVELSMDVAGMLDRQAAHDGRDEGGRYAPRPALWGFCEAPCGTGKGLAYGVPGVLASLRAEAEHEREVAAARKAGTPVPTEPRKLVVSTANIALQEQLVRKDFPALAAMLGVEDQLRVVLLKSRANYLCRYKVRALGGAMIADPRIDKLVQWMGEADCTGDREALAWDPGSAWADVSAPADECLGSSCAHYATTGGDARPCFWRQAVAGYKQAHVVVTNHHYLAVAPAIRSCLLAVDECHELEDSLRATQAATLAPYSGRGLAGRLEGVLGADAGVLVAEPVRWLMEQAALHLGSQQPAFGTQPPDVVKLVPGWLGAPGALADGERRGAAMRRALVDVERACTREGCTRMDRLMLPPRASAAGSQEAAEHAARLARSWEQMLRLCERYEAVLRAEPCAEWPAADLPWAIYLEIVKGRRGEDRVVAQMAPADVSWATALLAERYRTAVFTTATMPAYAPQRVALGLGVGEPGEGAPEPSYEKRLPSPFPLAQQGVLVVPHGPRPKEPGWAEWAAGQVVEAVRQARGGTLVLASSARQMRAYAQALRADSGCASYAVRVQGEAGRADLRRWFAEDVDGVLVATRSFFQGLDVQGDACRCVVIDRVPFARPDDPLEEAVGRLLVDRAGGGRNATAYMLRSVPSAAMVLAQGAGRLVRSRTDLGAVVLLDTRVLAPGEGWQVLRAALPPFPLSRDPGDVRRRMEAQQLAGVGQPTVGRVVRRSA